MYPGQHALTTPDKPAYIMANTGEVVTFGEYEARTNQLAHVFRNHGMAHGDHYAIFMENQVRYLECEGAGERSGLYYTCINSYLTAEEVAYIVRDCQAKALITSAAKREVALEVAALCPEVTLLLMVDADDNAGGSNGPFLSYEQTVAGQPITRITNESLGTPMLYSSGTTGRPKGILRPLPKSPPEQSLAVFAFLYNMFQYRPEMTYLSPAPLYHSAPQASVALSIRNGSTSIIMERFDPEQYLALVQKYKVTHSQLVPTMFSRMLKLPDDVRGAYDLSSLEVAIHAAAPCPVPVKEQMINWWGPILYEYYGATEGMGFTFCNSEEWLAHKGTVGKVILGDLQILDEDMKPLPQGEPGTLYFGSGTPFEYFNDAAKTADSRSADGAFATVGDVGYQDEEGFVFLTDRKTYMIIAGGVNIYPQECENLLITHPKVADAAVFGVPNEDMGEEVKAVVQLMPGVGATADIERELIAFCKEHLASIKCPRSVDFEAELPRLPTGKLYKRLLRDRYWTDRATRI